MILKPLTKKIGPLPVYAWAGIGVVGLFLLKHRGTAKPKAETPSNITLTPASNGSISGGSFTPPITVNPAPIIVPGGTGIRHKDTFNYQWFEKSMGATDEEQWQLEHARKTGGALPKWLQDRIDANAAGVAAANGPASFTTPYA